MDYVKDNYDGNYENLVRSIKTFGTECHVSVDELISNLDDRYDYEAERIIKESGKENLC